MSDENAETVGLVPASTETADRAVRAWILAIGAAMVIVGGEMMAEKDGARFGVGLAIALFSLPIHMTWVFWQKAKKHLTAGILEELRHVATSPRWWFGAILLILLALIFAPVIAVPRWPSLPFFRTQLTTAPTTLRLQFNDAGVTPEEISAKNVRWISANYDQVKTDSPQKKYVCDPNTISRQPFLGAQGADCSYVEIPTYIRSSEVILFLSFPDAVSASAIKLNSHGAKLPKWDSEILGNNMARIVFHGSISSVILDIVVVN